MSSGVRGARKPARIMGLIQLKVILENRPELGSGHACGGGPSANARQLHHQNTAHQMLASTCVGPVLHHLWQYYNSCIYITPAAQQPSLCQQRC